MRLFIQVLVTICAKLIAYLTFFRTPAFPLWYLRLGITEWGHWLAPLAVLPALGRMRRALGWPLWVLSLAVVGAQLPLWQARQIARRLPAELDAAFGPRETPVLPLTLMQLFSGRQPLQVAIQRHFYTNAAGQELPFDFYPALKANQAAPLVIVVHGGSWQGGNNSQLPALNHYLAQRGYAVAAINYRLAPQHPFPAARDDLEAAIRYLTVHADEFGIDAQRIVLLGRSAGAQLALLVGYTLHDPAIRGVVSFYGPTDLAWGYRIPANPLVLDSCATLENYLGGTPDHVAERYEQASPINAVGALTPPTLLIHGGKDEMVFDQHSFRLVARLQAANRPHLLLHLPWASHGCDANLYGPAGQLSCSAIEHFLAAVCEI